MDEIAQDNGILWPCVITSEGYFWGHFEFKSVASTWVQFSVVTELWVGETGVLAEICMHWMHYHLSVDMKFKFSVWIIIFLVTGLATGVCRGGHCNHRPETSLTSMSGSMWKILFMNTRWAQHITYLSHCWWSHTCQSLRHTSACYLFCHEMGKNTCQSWRWTFFTFVTAVKVQIMENHVQPLSVISGCSKHVCQVQILTLCNHWESYQLWYNIFHREWMTCWSYDIKSWSILYIG
jgi:hypothetical protein